MLLTHIRAGLLALLSFFGFIGSTCAGIIGKIFKAVFGYIYSLLSKMFKAIGGWLTKKFKQPLYDLWCYILTPFAHAFGAIDNTRIQLKKTKQLGVKHGVSTCISAIGKFFSGALTTAKFLFNYIAPAISIAFLLTLISHAGTLQYTISVEYNGNDLGVIKNEGDFNQAQALVQDKITYTQEDKAVLATPKFSVRMMQESDSPVDTNSLSELMMNASDVGIVSAYGMYINGSLVGVFDEEQMNLVKNALESRLAMYYSSDVISAEFEDNIEISQGRYIETNLTSADEMLEYISGSVRVDAFYVIEKGDSVSSIAKKLGYTRNQLIAENPLLEKGAKTGDVLTYHFDEPNLSVITYHYENYDQVIEKTTQYVYDSRAEKYCEVLKQHGSDGYENVTALVTEKNGVEAERTVVSRYVIESMVPQIYSAGTKENTYLKGNTKVIDKLGTFVWPVGGDGGYISSLFGYRKWDHSNHKGIDIPAKRGTDIYAAQSGVVTFAGTYSSYGKLVIIDHGGGYETYYGHQSSIDVEKGDRVEKGDVIGHVGMTGSASGNHLHFELRYNDDRLDPLLALGGVGRHEVRE